MKRNTIRELALELKQINESDMSAREIEKAENAAMLYWSREFEKQALAPVCPRRWKK